jgi:hypothetical protein
MANYTNPKLRESIKDRYKKAGGSYTGGKTKKTKIVVQMDWRKSGKPNQVNRVRKDLKPQVKDTFQKQL